MIVVLLICIRHPSFPTTTTSHLITETSETTIKMSRSLLFSSLKKSFTNLSKSIDLNDMQNQPNHHDLLKAVSESAISHQMIHKIDDSLASAAINLKLESKVKSLERVIERMESAHANTLVGLHKEVERLSNLVSGISI